ncbi:MAG: HD domain-containing protein [Clostridium butyricum]|nr:HD domain-containing protein [Clostridium butyricum]
MDARKLMSALHIAEKLKDTTRHCYTSGGRHESVAEHSWRISLMAYWVADEFPEADMNKVIKMCLIHDLGECFTGDIPTFMKTSVDETKEENLLYAWVETLPNNYKKEMVALYKEMAERKTIEAKIFKAMDSLEALIQHNESDIKTWSDNEYDLNLTYADDKVSFSTFLKELRQIIREETIEKIESSKNINIE